MQRMSTLSYAALNRPFHLRMLCNIYTLTASIRELTIAVPHAGIKELTEKSGVKQ